VEERDERIPSGVLWWRKKRFRKWEEDAGVLIENGVEDGVEVVGRA
jgi:hypothetical protein